MQHARPRLKDIAWVDAPDGVTLTGDPGIEVTIAEPEPQLLELLGRLDGSADTNALAAGLELDRADVADALAGLDAAGLLEDAAAGTRLSATEQERFRSNLNFFATFASLDRSRYAFQERLTAARVVVLGAGGVGSAVLAALAGLGVGAITIVDDDRVELANLNRQLLYTMSDLGRPKAGRAAAWAERLGSGTDVRALHERIASAADVRALIGGADLVVCAIDQPEDVYLWVNDACVSAGVPLVTGGVWAARAGYMSVRPGVSGCLACLEASEPSRPLIRPSARTNRAIAPTTGLLAGLMSLEALRYLTGFAAPVAAGALWLADVTTGEVQRALQWQRRDDCDRCAQAH